MSARAGWKSFVVRHLYTYLALLCGLVVAAGALLAQEALATAWRRLQWPWLLVALLLTLLNYSLRFTKWERMLSDCSIELPRSANAKLYFACLAMVVTPGRLGELYKLVFLRRLHGVPASRSLPPLVMERITDALAVLLLVIPYFLPEAGIAVAALAVAAGGVLAVGRLLSMPTWTARATAWVTRLPRMHGRGPSVEGALRNQRVLLRPQSLAPTLGLSLLAWWAECAGLLCILRGLGVEVALHDATWIYAASTLLGNLTFLPGGLGFTEVTLVALLARIGIEQSIGIGATALVRAVTLWFAVLLGVTTSLVFRRSLRWDEVRAEAQTEA